MFTRKELVAELPGLSASAPRPLEIVEFGHQDFTASCSEQCIKAFRGNKLDFASALHFWVDTLQAQGWEHREADFLPYAEAGLCEPLSKAEFSVLVAEYSGSLRDRLPSFLRKLDGYRSGPRMYAAWNDVGAVAELDKAFVAFYWSTTA
jgi:hypothetical protein